ncbi:hypothetical protein A3D72_00240 [Candidatus Uhrbacteria bacterium RIFCSPHIGHO2_02_FULL_57_19]|uniref:S1 motif domain-containing protein n=1 Tax=Candidatus Uhrbacteria bacterium RIFCSPHIGHO2_02_FULL_57_19 TaxID=1802391 RepID=A0A1F7U6M5_9BACT|nr:MAG: hypothetical protein A3D72_00240 [Candidatus Uhrbacteria bacterium RIFCSPHIGHO2_02_FULL_57_19]
MQLLTKEDKKTDSEFKRLLGDEQFLRVPKVGDVIKGTVLSVARNEVRIDLPGYKTGVVRGAELFQESGEPAGLKLDAEVEATVVELENENGDVELSFRFAGVRRLWDSLQQLRASGAAVPAEVIEANKGGLMIRVNRAPGFLPVSQLSPEHYPRVAGGEKQKILEKLRGFIGTTLMVKILDASEAEEKLIVSEKAVWEDEQRSTLERFHVGDTVEGEVTALTDFGAFVKFSSGEAGGPELEGLVHISEIAWQRIDHPRDVLAVGDKVKSQIIGLQGSKIFLSLKRLTDDPWKTVASKYQVGQWVKGKIIKANPFGFFVELDPQIHGLAHVSELSDKPIHDPQEVAKVGDELEWRVVSVDPESHRLGLSLKKETAPAEEKTEEKKAEEPAAA